MEPPELVALVSMRRKGMTVLRVVIRHSVAIF